MPDTDLATGSDDAFTPEEQAAFDAYERGEEAPASDGLTPPAAEPASTAAEPPAAEPETGEPEAAPDAQPRDEKGKFVPHGALHEERERRKAVEKERDELRERFARGDERLRILSEAMQRPAAPAQPAATPEPAKVPDPAEDIFGYIEHLKGEIEAVGSGAGQGYFVAAVGEVKGLGGGAEPTAILSDPQKRSDSCSEIT